MSGVYCINLHLPPKRQCTSQNKHILKYIFYIWRVGFKRKIYLYYEMSRFWNDNTFFLVSIFNWDYYNNGQSLVFVSLICNIVRSKHIYNWYIGVRSPTFSVTPENGIIVRNTTSSLCRLALLIWLWGEFMVFIFQIVLLHI